MNGKVFVRKVFRLNQPDVSYPLSVDGKVSNREDYGWLGDGITSGLYLVVVTVNNEFNEFSLTSVSIKVLLDLRIFLKKFR